MAKRVSTQYFHMVAIRGQGFDSQDMGTIWHEIQIGPSVRLGKAMSDAGPWFTAPKILVKYQQKTVETSLYTPEILQTHYKNTLTTPM